MICLEVFQFVQINCLVFKCPINKAWRYLQTLYILYTKAINNTNVWIQHEEVSCSFHYMEALQDVLSSPTEFPVLMGKASGLNA